MVDEFSSEEEQIEAIKKWLRTHGPSIAIGIAVGLAAIGGWRYWLQSKEHHAEQAAAIYEEFSTAINADDSPEAVGHAAVLQADFANSAYASLAQFKLAKFAVDNDDMEAGLLPLRWVIDHSEQPEIVQIARLRLVRLLLASGSVDAAREQLNQVSGTGFAAELEELSGDIYLASSQTGLAKTAYEAAQAAAGPGSAGQLLQLKIDNLPPEQ